MAALATILSRCHAERFGTDTEICDTVRLNDANETIGKIDDLLVSPDGKAPFVVLSIGGFLGMGARLVVVPYDSLKLVDNKVVLPGGTKEMLKMLPEFKYAKE